MSKNLVTIETLLKQREVKKAEILIAKQLRVVTNPFEHGNLLILRGRTRLLSARPEAAIDDLARARTFQPELFESPLTLEILADSHFARFELSTVGFADRGDTQQSEQIYRKIIADYPTYDNLGWIYYQLGRVLLTSNQIDAAVDCFQQALLTPSSFRPLTAYCYERLGFVAFYEQRDFNRSMTFLNKAVDTYPSNEDRSWLVQVYILRSRVQREGHLLSAALQEAEKALALAISGRGSRQLVLAEALLTTGELLASIDGREKDAIDRLEQFLQVSRRPLGIDVTWSRVYEMLGNAYFKVGRYNDAITAYNAVLQFNPYHPWEITIYHRIGCAYYQQGNYEKSADAINHALEAAHKDGYDPDYHLYDVYANAQFALGHYDQAAEAYATALRLAPPHNGGLDKIRKYHQMSLSMLNQ